MKTDKPFFIRLKAKRLNIDVARIPRKNNNVDSPKRAKNVSKSCKTHSTIRRIG